MDKYYKIVARADQEADILIYGEIGDSWFDESVTARQFRNDLKALEQNNTRINVHINSVGGSVWDGLAIYNALRSSPVDIHTYNDGIALSMGALVLMAGKTVHAASNSLTMLHAPSLCICGNSKDLTKAINVLDKVENSLVDCIVTRTKEKESDVRTMWFDGEDHWLNADEAKAFGFIDVIEDEKIKVDPKVKNLNYSEVIARMDEFVKPQQKKNSLVQWVNNLFSHETSSDLIIENDMDIIKLRNAFGMDDSANEETILDRISQLVQDNGDLQKSLADMKSELEREAAQRASVEQEFEDFKSKPGATSANLDVDTDAVPGPDAPATDFFSALASVKEMMNP